MALFTEEIRYTNPPLDGLEFDGDTVLCRVCGDKASGFHYGVHACEGCKGFFRRSIQQKIQYRPCLKNQQCNILRVNRNRCQYCRLKKCIAVGMSRDAVRFGRVPKREKAKIMEQMQKVNAQSQSSVMGSILDNEHDVIQKIIDVHMKTCEFTRPKLEALLEKAWQNPVFVNCPAHMACPLNPNPDSSENVQKWEEFSECFTPAIRNVVNFAKGIPGFQVLSQEDQVTLLKAGTFEVLLVHLSCLFDSNTGTMVFTNGKMYKRSNFSSSSCAGFLLDSMFDFAERINSLRLTDEEIALFSALVIIAADRPGLRNMEQVDIVHSVITQGLQALMTLNHPDDTTIFAKLLMKLPDLRTLNTLHSEKLLGLNVQHIPNRCPVTEKSYGSPAQGGDHGMNSRPLLLPGGACPPPRSALSLANTVNALAVPLYQPLSPGSAPLIPHPVPMETAKQNRVVLQTQFGTFHRQSPVKYLEDDLRYTQYRRDSKTISSLENKLKDVDLLNQINRFSQAPPASLGLTQSELYLKMMDSLSFEHTSLQYTSEPPSTLPSLCSSPELLDGMLNHEGVQKEEQTNAKTTAVAQQVLPSSEKENFGINRKRSHEADNEEIPVKFQRLCDQRELQEDAGVNRDRLYGNANEPSEEQTDTKKDKFVHVSELERHLTNDLSDRNGNDERKSQGNDLVSLLPYDGKPEPKSITSDSSKKTDLTLSSRQNGLKLPVLQSALMAPPLVQQQPWFMFQLSNFRGNRSDKLKENLSREEKLRQEIMYGTNRNQFASNKPTETVERLVKDASHFQSSDMMSNHSNNVRSDKAAMLAGNQENRILKSFPFTNRNDSAIHMNVANKVENSTPIDKGYTNGVTANDKKQFADKPPKLFPENMVEMKEGHMLSDHLLPTLERVSNNQQVASSVSSSSNTLSESMPSGNISHLHFNVNKLVNSFAVSAPSSQMRDVIHASTVSTLKDKILKRIDSLENLNTNKDTALFRGKDIVRDLNSNISSGSNSAFTKDSFSSGSADKGLASNMLARQDLTAAPSSVRPAVYSPISFSSSLPSHHSFFPMGYPPMHPALLYQVNQFAAAQQLALQQMQQQQIQQQQLQQRKAAVSSQAEKLNVGTREICKETGQPLNLTKKFEEHAIQVPVKCEPK